MDNEQPKKKQKKDKNVQFVELCIAGDLDEVKEYLDQHDDLDVSFDNNAPLNMACYHDQEDVVRFLLKHPKLDHSDHHKNAIYAACISGKENCLKILLKNKHTDPSCDDNCAIRNALSIGVIRILLKDPRVDPSAKNNDLLKKMMSKVEFHKGIREKLNKSDRFFNIQDDNQKQHITKYNNIISLLSKDKRVKDKM